MKHHLIFLWLLFFLAGCVTLPEQGASPTAVPTVAVTSLSEQEDESFSRDTIFLEGTEIRLNPDQPGMVFLHVEGQLPTPCHQFGSQICPSCAQNSPNLIVVTVYSLIETGKVCRGPTTPFEQDIPLGVYTEGTYSVEVNGKRIGTFDAEK